MITIYLLSVDIKTKLLCGFSSRFVIPHEESLFLLCFGRWCTDLLTCKDTIYRQFCMFYQHVHLKVWEGQIMFTCKSCSAFKAHYKIYLTAKYP